MTGPFQSTPQFRLKTFILSNSHSQFLRSSSYQPSWFPRFSSIAIAGKTYNYLYAVRRNYAKMNVGPNVLVKVRLFANILKRYEDLYQAVTMALSVVDRHIGKYNVQIYQFEELWLACHSKCHGLRVNFTPPSVRDWYIVRHTVMHDWLMQQSMSF